MPGAVLRRRGIVDYDGSAYLIPGFDEMTAAERHELIALCHAKFDEFLEKRADPWSHRRKSAGYVSGTLRYEVLKRAVFRCELCGVSAEDRALEVDHIVPRNAGGSDDPSNLQAQAGEGGRRASARRPHHRPRGRHAAARAAGP